MERLQLIAKYLTALAVIYLSTAILLFVHEASETRKAIPLLIEKLDSIENSDKVLEVLRLAAQITGNTAEIADEVSAVRKDLPALYAEIDKTRAVIPGILTEMKAVRGDLPALYAEVEKSRRVIPGILEEVRKTRALVPDVLVEVQAVRKEAPQLLAETKVMLDRAKKISDEAGKGAVHGAVKGILTAPLDVIESGISGVKERVTPEEKKKP